MSELNLIDSAGMLAVIDEPAIGQIMAMYVFDGQVLVVWEVNKVKHSKWITSTDMCAAWSGQEKDTGWHPAGVVRSGSSPQGNWFVYSAPAQKVKVTIEGIEGVLTIPIPRTVMLGVGAVWHIWAIKSEHFNPDAAAYRAPFPNVDNSGRICWGGNTAPKANVGTAREAWELFFSTPFNNHAVDGKSEIHKNNVIETLRTLTKGKYPLADLVSVDNNRLIGSLIARILEG